VRLFVGIAIPEEVARRVRAFVDSLRPLAPLRWSQITDLHLTTKFIGDQPPARRAEIDRALGTFRRPRPFPLTVRGIGWFPGVENPRVFWAGIDASTGLAQLAADTERALAPLGVAIEQRPYAPHITLARVPPRAPIGPLREALRSPAATEFGAFTVERFNLYESVRANAVARYDALATFPLSDEAS
jgi:2'-5' RNA ligase